MNLIINFLVSGLFLWQLTLAGDCYNSGGYMQCSGPAKDVTEIFYTDGDIPKITKKLLSHLKNLKSVTIKQCNVEEVEPGSFDALKLQLLKINYNPLKKIKNGTFNSQNAVTILELHSNDLETIEAGVFEGMESLDSLSLNGNRITKLNKDAFVGLKHLEYLYINHNKIEALEVGTFDSLNSLKVLELTGNALTDLPMGLFEAQVNLEKLDLSINKLVNLPDKLFSKLTTLESLVVTNNRLTDITDILEGLPNLKTLNIQDNEISHLELAVFDHLSKLWKVELNKNPWNCESLQNLMTYFKNHNVSVPVLSPVTTTSNVDGIGCQEN